MKDKFILGALPLFIYPFVALASLMSLAGHTAGQEPVLRMAVSRSFHICSLVFPIVYLGCVVASVRMQTKKESVAAKIASVPLCFLGVICASFVVWVAVEGHSTK